MLKIKIQSNFTKFFAAILLILFVSSGSLALFHAFSHHEIIADESASIKVQSLEKTFFAKIIFAHEKSAGKNSENCFLCSFSNFQSQVSLAPNLIFLAASFYLVFAFRKFDRVKLSYLLSSQAPRAPPVIS